MMIDVHTHTFPEKIAAAAVDKLQKGSHTHPFTDGTQGMLKQSMEKAGIDASLVLPVATSARQVPHVNDASIRMNEQALETGVWSLGCMHPDYADWRKELGRLSASGVKGVKLHPPYQEVDFDDARYLRILDRCGELGLIVLTHAGLDVGLPGHTESTPEKIARAVKAVGPVKLILAHMGGWRNWDQAEKLLPDTGVYLDTSFSLGPMTPNGDGFYQTKADLDRLTEAAFVRLVRVFGADRVLFGTDSPWEDQAAEVQKIQALPLTAEEKTAILGGNAQRLLGLNADESPYLKKTPG